MKIVNHSETASARRTLLSRQTWPIFLLLVFACGAGGCGEYYAAQPAYGPGYYAGRPAYAPGYYGGPAYGPGYGYGGGSVVVEIGDRPYYTRGPGYYVGRSYYVWRPGHWAVRNGQRIWIHGHYVLRG
jgi:WXXGXW repeat (2 copies)